VDEVRVRMVAAEVGQRLASGPPCLRCGTERALEDRSWHRVRSPRSSRRRRHGEAARRSERADRIEVEELLHQLGIVGDRIDHLDRHPLERGGADRVEIDIGASAILLEIDPWSRAKIASVIFSGAGPPLPILYLMPKSSVGPPGLWLAERMMPPKALYFGSRWRRQASRGCRPGRPSPGRSRRRPPSSGRLDHLAVVEAAVAADRPASGPR
jgi:hypothetical protein